MSRLRKFLQDSRVRLALILLIVGATLAVFIQYLTTHPDVINIVFGMHPAAVTLIAIAYTGTILANAFVLSASLRMIGTRVGFIENASLTGYSSIVNFFGPLQSGPGFRAAYLKQRHGVSLGKFFYATVVFYGFFFVINATVVLAALALKSPDGLGVIVAVAAAFAMGVGAWLAYRFIPRSHRLFTMVKITNINFWLIGLGALALSLCTTAAYFVELIHVDPTITVVQTVVYAAVANLALFVSLTPGAIGFRESFLVLTQQLHNLPSNIVLAASIIDRAFYVLFLLALFVFLLAIGARAKLKSKSH